MALHRDGEGNPSADETQAQMMKKWEKTAQGRKKGYIRAVKARLTRVERRTPSNIVVDEVDGIRADRGRMFGVVSRIGRAFYYLEADRKATATVGQARVAVEIDQEMLKNGASFLTLFDNCARGKYDWPGVFEYRIYNNDSPDLTLLMFFYGAMGFVVDIHFPSNHDSSNPGG